MAFPPALFQLWFVVIGRGYVSQFPVYGICESCLVWQQGYPRPVYFGDCSGIFFRRWKRQCYRGLLIPAGPQTGRFGHSSG